MADKKLTRIYQDIDGCWNAELNAKPWKREGDTDQRGYQRAMVVPVHNDKGEKTGSSGWGYRMEWNERMVEEYNKLEAELVYATTWRADGPKVAKAMGVKLPKSRILHPRSGLTTFPSIEWKFDAIIAEQEQDPSPFIAIDDEWDDVSPFRREALEKLGGLVIAPFPTYGLEPKHLEAMREYIEAHS